MILGLSTKVMRDYSLEEGILIAKELGYKAIEFWIDDIKSSNMTPQEIIELTDKYGIQRSVHLLTEDLNIASFNEGIRKESLRQQKEALKLAAQIGADNATLHPGRRTAKTRTLEEAWKVQLESISELAQTAKECGVTLCVEGMEKFPGEFILAPQDLRYVLDSCNQKDLQVTLDIAHLQTIGNSTELIKDSKDLPVGNVHISQAANGKPHYTVYDEKGEVNFEEVFKELSKFYNGALIIEGYIPQKGYEIAKTSMEWYQDIMNKINSK